MNAVVHEQRRLAVSFRKHPKATLFTKIPVEIVHGVKLRALDQGKVPNQVVAELLCDALGLDPARFGIDPVREPMAAGCGSSRN
jgi:hypothetical protein